MTEKEIQLLGFERVDEPSYYFYRSKLNTKKLIYFSNTNLEAEENNGNWNVTFADVYQYDNFIELQSLMNNLDRHAIK